MLIAVEHSGNTRLEYNRSVRGESQKMIWGTQLPHENLPEHGQYRWADKSGWLLITARNCDWLIAADYGGS